MCDYQISLFELSVYNNTTIHDPLPRYQFANNPCLFVLIIHDIYFNLCVIIRYHYLNLASTTTTQFTILSLDTNSLTTHYMLFNTLLTSIHIVLGSYHLDIVVPLPSPCGLCYWRSMPLLLLWIS